MSTFIAVRKSTDRLVEERQIHLRSVRHSAFNRNADRTWTVVWRRLYTPLSLSDPTGPIAALYQDIGAFVVREVAKNQLRSRANRGIRPRPKRMPQSSNFRRQRRAPILRFGASVRKSDQSARAKNSDESPDILLTAKSPGRFRTRLRRDGWKLRGQRHLARWVQPSRAVSSVENVT